MVMFISSLNSRQQADNLNVYAGGLYGYGGASSPDTAFVESVEGEWVHFRKYPYQESRREQLSIFTLLASSGTRTELKRLQNFIDHPEMVGGEVPEWMLERAEHYRAVLAGETGRTWNVDDMRHVGLVIRYSGTGDGWSEWERYYPHCISGATLDGTELTTYDFSASEAAELRTRLDAGEFPDFAFAAITEYR